ncbi:MAG: nucleoside triphosphate pyrophosphohydrolase [Thermodesulfobacteriota bacterium]
MKKNSEIGEKFTELLHIIDRLRGPGGCPWDQKQTVQSFKPYFIEESHELSEALEGDDPLQVREELGDLLFQIGFLNRLYEEADHFTITEVLQAIIDKMIRRHPHVFADVTFDSYEEMRKNWGKVKEKEKKAKKSTENELDVPKSLPALIRAQRIIARTSRRGFDRRDTPALVDSLERSQQKLLAAIAAGDRVMIHEKLGTMLFQLTRIAGKYELAAEECLQTTVNNFVRSFKEMERRIAGAGKRLEELDENSLADYWREVMGRSGDSRMPD